MEQLQSHIWLTASWVLINVEIFAHFLIQYIRKPFLILYMTLQLLHSEFLIYEENFEFLFYQCVLFGIPFYTSTGSLTTDHWVHTEWKCHFLAYITMEKSAKPAEGGGCTPTPFHCIYHHVQSCGVRCSWEGRYIPNMSTRPLYVLCAPDTLSPLQPSVSWLLTAAFW